MPASWKNIHKKRQIRLTHLNDNNYHYLTK